MSDKECRTCKCLLPIDNFFYRKDSRKHRNECKICWSKKTKSNYEANKSDRNAKSRAWYENNKEFALALSKQNRKDNQARSKVGILTKQACNRRGIEAESNDYLSMVGLPTWLDLEVHLMQTAIDNYGAWCINTTYELDHRTPLRYAKTFADIVNLTHYTNLQLLYPEDNSAKRSKLNWTLPK